ncbi:PbsX family transcriptional regulator [Photorhabdus luminescens]|uniref:AbrB/MazE/SpoVT family DNA-binding domain-containing protein n=1 Tax=Photorhabdus luminescens TaxID=29488 RepID=UPI001F02E9A1|nr:PbsX family transcriptional regulator [Photorhabdus luminescens]
MKMASLSVDDTVNISVEDGKVVIVPVKAKEYNLDALLAGVKDENIHAEVNFSAPVGKEIL